ncbi:MmcQ/YjbR family DNA-binding protein [Streptomyces sp. B93]|uniref:MmcQ/YjbR family DNA-binding protein n=1 Tax=Streptomyces sp. B93 TaxID=2824875 RepID=UPI001B36D636|nr:MmcQ/YjbR family DNA-binding protein [Streptomyces sp. B93]MBQ1093328.1 MmcQ/YjbR family DNA-binding protein [Streptomyces sp. B93]
MDDRPTDFFTRTSRSALARSDVATGTMMGFPCLRVAGGFFASCDRRSGDLIVKLPRERVQELIEAGVGSPFAPAGRTFREWVLVSDRDETLWVDLIDEARVFVAKEP